MSALSTIRLAVSLVYSAGRKLLVLIILATIVTSVAIAGQLVVGRTIVDLTLDDIGRDPVRLRALSEGTGVQVVMGCGHYSEGAHPAGVRARTAARQP